MSPKYMSYNLLNQRLIKYGILIAILSLLTCKSPDTNTAIIHFTITITSIISWMILKFCSSSTHKVQESFAKSTSAPFPEALTGYQKWNYAQPVAIFWILSILSSVIFFTPNRMIFKILTATHLLLLLCLCVGSVKYCYYYALEEENRNLKPQLIKTFSALTLFTLLIFSVAFITTDFKDSPLLNVVSSTDLQDALAGIASSTENSNVHGDSPVMSATIVPFTESEKSNLLSEVTRVHGEDVLLQTLDDKTSIFNTQDGTFYKFMVIAGTPTSDDIYWYEYHKYISDTETHFAGDIALWQGMKSSALTKSDVFE